MPMIKIEFDYGKVSDDEIRQLAVTIQKVVSHSTGIEDVFVYANSARIKVQVAPIEIFVEMSASKIENLNDLTAKIKEQLSDWKTESGFKLPINLTVIPMHWKVEVDI
jgi:hypothetical protein